MLSSRIHKRRKPFKTYKNVHLQKRIVVAKVCRETFSKKDKKIEKKNDQKRSKLTPQIKKKGNAERDLSLISPLTDHFYNFSYTVSFGD